MYVCVNSLSHVRRFTTLCTTTHQVPLSIGFSRQEHWSGLPFPPPEDLPDPGIEPLSLASPALTDRFFLPLSKLINTYINECVNKEQKAIGNLSLKCCQVHIPLVLLIMQYLSFGEGNGNLLLFFPGKSQGQRNLMATTHGVTRLRPNLATKPPSPPIFFFTMDSLLKLSNNICERTSKMFLSWHSGKYTTIKIKTAIMFASLGT